MRIRMNAGVKTTKYGLLEGGREYELEREDAIVFAKKRLNHLEMLAAIIDPDDSPEEAEKLIQDASELIMKKKKATLKIKKALIESNEKTGASKKLRLKEIEKEELALAKTSHDEDDN